MKGVGVVLLAGGILLMYWAIRHPKPNVGQAVTQH